MLEVVYPSLIWPSLRVAQRWHPHFRDIWIQPWLGNKKPHDFLHFSRLLPTFRDVTL